MFFRCRKPAQLSPSSTQNSSTGFDGEVTNSRIRVSFRPRAPEGPRSAPGGPREQFWEDFGASWANFGRIFGTIFDSLFDASRQHFRDLLPPPEAFRQLFSERFSSPLRRPQTSETQETATPHKIQRTGEVFPGRGRGGVGTPQKVTF